MPQRLEPLGDRVLVRRDAEVTTGKIGLVMPEGAKEKPVMGTVVEVGRGRKLDNGSILTVDLTPGDRVTFGKFAGSDYTLNGEKLLIMREDEVLGRLHGEPDADVETVRKQIDTIADAQSTASKKKRKKR